MARKRLQFDFSPQAVAEVDALVAKTGSASRAEVVRKALKLLSLVVDQQSKGGHLVIVDSDGEKQAFHFL